mmetsp:Transcript_36084/g.66569  ORF Transcript_36084/g.66569 Transcript_36084/m.66569 type:complete len:425 (-) Transcript_36084:111-1385(-)
MADAAPEINQQPAAQPTHTDPPPAPTTSENSEGGMPPLPISLEHAADLIETALASRKMTVKENPTLQMKWEQMYSRLLQYKEKNGNCLVPNRYKEDRSLGQWVSAQRRQYKQLQNGEDSPMTKERATLLESVGFVWATLERGHVPWEVRYQELMAYKEKNGDCLVPIGFKENPQLSSWVSTQRQEMKLLKEGRPTRLTEDRIRLLDSGGFVWESQRGKRGGRKKKRRSSDVSASTHSSVSPPPPSGNFTSARPSTMATRIITDSESSLPSFFPSSGEVVSSGNGRAVTDPSQFDDADGGLMYKKYKTTSEYISTGPTPHNVCSAPSIHHPDHGIFDDADEHEDLHTVAAVDTYFKEKRASNIGSSLQSSVNNVTLPPPPRLTNRKVTCCDTKEEVQSPAPKNNSQEQSQQEEAAVALLSVGRAI